MRSQRTFALRAVTCSHESSAMSETVLTERADPAFDEVPEQRDVTYFTAGFMIRKREVLMALPFPIA